MSDSELLIADAMAMLGPIWEEALRMEDYGIHMNTAYTHVVEDEELSGLLNEMKAKGWVRTMERSENLLRFGLTSDGGQIWEDEREPAWSKYCSAGFYEEQEISYCSVLAYDQEIGEQYIRAHHDAGHLDFDIGKGLSWRSVTDYGIRYWDDGDKIWECCAPCPFPVEPKLCGNWWSNLHELQLFQSGKEEIC
jgi:hypothetical protein